MIRKARAFIGLLILFTFFASNSTVRDESFARTEDRRDQKLFLAAANLIADGKYSDAKIVLKTLIYTYPESPLVEQARVLVFYSDARQENQRNEEARRILKEVEGYLTIYHPKRPDQ